MNICKMTGFDRDLLDKEYSELSVKELRSMIAYYDSMTSLTQDRRMDAGRYSEEKKKIKEEIAKRES